MTSLRGLSNLSHVPEGVSINFNPALTSVEGMDNLTKVGKRFTIAVCPVTSLQGLVLQSIGGTPGAINEGFELLSTELVNLIGLDDLHKVDGDILISNNAELITFDGLNNLNSIGGFLKIQTNEKLENIEALNSLESIGSDLWITGNDSLSLCSVHWVCQYLQDPSGIIFFASNATGCQNENEVLAHCSPVNDFKLIDANLTVGTNSSMQGDSAIVLLSPDQLLQLNEYREGTTADGVSSVVLQLEFQKPGFINLSGPDADNFEFPWGDQTYDLDDGHYCFILYTPPEVFVPNHPTFLFQGVVEAYNEVIDFDFMTDTGVRSDSLSIPIVRPPVVLVHGTYSDPEKAWKTPIAGGISFYDRLVSEGFKVFTVNYKETNGSVGFTSDHTGFADNAKVVWGDVYPENTGG
ncbi:MAG: hypothetical protein WBB36_05015, partial [Chitinophagales bacterium]